MRTPRKSFIALFLVIAGIGYGAYQLSALSATNIPQAFNDARNQSAMIAQQIVISSDDIVHSLNRVSALEQAGSRTEALDTLANVTDQSSDIRTRARELSEEIEQMANALTSIESERAREVAIQAINYRLELISHLITYSNVVHELLESLRAEIRGEIVPEGTFAGYIEKINGEIAAINELNDHASEAMERFDELTQ